MQEAQRGPSQEKGHPWVQGPQGIAGLPSWGLAEPPTTPQPQGVWSDPKRDQQRARQIRQREPVCKSVSCRDPWCLASWLSVSLCLSIRVWLVLLPLSSCFR